MKNIHELIDEAIYYDKDGFPLFEMANLTSNKTGLTNDSLVIYVSTKQSSHASRVKVFKKGQIGRGKPNVAFSISKEPEIVAEHNLKLSKQDISEIKYWISINHVLLLKLWNSLNWENVIISDYIDNFEKIN